MPCIAVAVLFATMQYCASAPLSTTVPSHLATSLYHSKIPLYFALAFLITTRLNLRLSSRAITTHLLCYALKTVPLLIKTAQDRASANQNYSLLFHAVTSLFLTLPLLKATELIQNIAFA